MRHAQSRAAEVFDGRPDSVLTPPAATVSRSDRVFPTLTPAQIARVASHGRRRAITPGEVLAEVGQRPVPFFVVLNGEVQVLQTSGGTEGLFTTLGAGNSRAKVPC
jgi:thioredoxin reductase (NADPH)